MPLGTLLSIHFRSRYQMYYCNDTDKVLRSPIMADVNRALLMYPMSFLYYLSSFTSISHGE